MSASSENDGTASVGHANDHLPQPQVNAVGSKQEGVPKGVLEDGRVDQTYPAVRAWFGTIQAGCKTLGVAKPDGPAETSGERRVD